MKNYIGITTLLILGATASYASLIPIGPVPNSGSGLGAVTTILTFTSPAGTSSETGCVGAGPGGTTVTGATKCPAGFVGGNEQAVNNLFSTASAGFTNFGNFQFIFNASEPGGGAEGITLDNLALTIWSSAGVLLQTHTLAAPYVIPDAFPGVGNAGFGFTLDAAQAAAANALLLPPGTVLYVGAAANATNATGGLETIFARTAEIPEPGTISMLGSGLLLVGLASFRKRLRNSR